MPGGYCELDSGNYCIHLDKAQSWVCQTGVLDEGLTMGDFYHVSCLSIKLTTYLIKTFFLYEFEWKYYVILLF